jgi:phosphatidylserine decarboxylase
MKLHKEGTMIIAGSTFGLLALNFASFTLLSEYVLITWPLLVLSIALWAIILWFFRLPARSHKAAENELVSPCDGKVVVIEEVEESEYFKDRRLQISVFMSPLNVHVNWVPCSGEVSYVKYHPGKYLVAWHPKSSTENERSTIVIKHNSRHEVLVRQIAGALARRIVYYLRPQQKVAFNEELGFIKFGSRVDLYLPIGSQVKVKLGEKVSGNHSILASWPD